MVDDSKQDPGVNQGDATDKGGPNNTKQKICFCYTWLSVYHVPRPARGVAHVQRQNLAESRSSQHLHIWHLKGVPDGLNWAEIAQDLNAWRSV